MSMNGRSTVVDYEAVADERATASGATTNGPTSSSFARLAILLVALVLLVLVVALFLQSGAQPAS